MSAEKLERYISKLEENLINKESLLSQTIATLKRTQISMVIKMAVMVEKRDPQMSGHVEKIKNYVYTLAKELSRLSRFNGIINREYIERLCEASILHDIGKVDIPDKVLLKPGGLTAEEFEIIKGHTTMGADILEGVDYLQMARDVALSHHERWDGKGYPSGLLGEDIPLAARIVSLADVYDALTSRRVYRDPLPNNKVVEIISEERGNAFDPDVVGAFLNRLSDFLLIRGHLHKFRYTEKFSLSLK